MVLLQKAAAKRANRGNPVHHTTTATNSNLSTSQAAQSTSLPGFPLLLRVSAKANLIRSPPYTLRNIFTCFTPDDENSVAMMMILPNEREQLIVTAKDREKDVLIVTGTVDRIALEKR